PRGRPVALHVEEILHRDGDAVERPAVEPRPQFLRGLGGGLPRFVPEHLIEGVQLGILRLDPVEIHLDQGLRRQLARAEFPPRFDDAHHGAIIAAEAGRTDEQFPWNPGQIDSKERGRTADNITTDAKQAQGERDLMALIPDRTLETVTAADIPGADTAPVASVREIRRSPTALMARMKDARITVSADFEEGECSACPSVPCPHFSAALLAWVKKRVPVREPKRLGLIDRLLSSPGWKNADHFAADYFKNAAGEVDVKSDGSLQIRLRAGKRSALFELPADDAPSFLWNLPKNIQKSEKLKGIRVSRKPIAPELRAEYDDRRRIVL